MGGAAGTADVGSGALGEKCSLNGSFACKSHNERPQFACSGGVWISNGSCAAGQSCDTRSGSNQGLCAPIAGECMARKAGEPFCQGNAKSACNPDLSSVDTIETCKDACVLGTCTECEPGKKRCTSQMEQTCDSNGKWGPGQVCPSTAPVCGADGCTNPPSCTGAHVVNCGALGNCCASTLVPGGTFMRSTPLTPTVSATVSPFRLDNYEVTVGRFRKFAAMYRPTMIQAGEGKNPNNPADQGWDAAWNTDPNMPANLVSALRCSADTIYGTWTALPGNSENKPINCVSWYLAEAFCIWDGGRLPTEAESQFAAAAPDQGATRLYPWGPESPTDGSRAAYYCNYNNAGTAHVCIGIQNIAAVGSFPAGDGKWGHSDLAGNLEEWVQDWYGPNPDQCNNCANFVPSTWHSDRGGNFRGLSSFLQSTARDAGGTSAYTGIRCARNP